MLADSSDDEPARPAKTLVSSDEEEKKLDSSDDEPTQKRAKLDSGLGRIELFEKNLNFLKKNQRFEKN